MGLPLFWVAGNEHGLGFGEEVELAFAWDADVSGECQREGRSRSACRRRAVDGGEQYFLGALLVVLVVAGEVLGYVFGEGIGVKVDESAKEYILVAPR